MQNRLLSQAIEKLADDFARRDWKYLDVEPGSRWEKTFCWPGQQKEEIMICVHKGNMIQEDFHRQDFFFFNFAYKGSYGAFSYRYDNHITVREGEMPGMRSVSGMKKTLSLSGSSCVRRHFSAPFCPSCLQMPDCSGSSWNRAWSGQAFFCKVRRFRLKRLRSCWAIATAVIFIKHSVSITTCRPGSMKGYFDVERRLR